MFQSNQRRASAPKVRTGCITCKTRRVKCDETKPRCRQCIKTVRECVWKRPQQATTTRALVPITSAKPGQVMTLVKTPTQALPFENTREPQYFQTYQEQVAKELAAAIRASPWVESVLRACHTEPTILRAVVAIGALNKSRKLAHFANHGPVAMKEITMQAAASHREFAISSYSKALVGLRRISETASTSPTSLRHVLIGCLLVQCMEVYLESVGSGFEQFSKGYKLLLDYISTNSSVASSYDWIASPNTAVIEDPIFHEYMRLESDRSLSPYTPSLSYHQQARNVGADTIAKIPSRFISLEEGQSYQELLLQRTTHLIAEIRATIKQTYALLGHPVTSQFPGHILDPYIIPHLSHLFPVRDEYLASLHAWQAAFAPLLSQLSLSPDTRLSVGSAIQQTKNLNAIVALSTILSTSETAYDDFYAAHAEIIALIMRSMKVTPHVVNDLRPMFALSTTFHYPIADLSVNCRDKGLREQAIATMIRQSTRDNELERWARVFSHKYLIAVEERNRGDDGRIPEHLRYRIFSLHRQEHNRQLTVVLTSSRGSGPEPSLYPTSRRYRWRTWSEQEVTEFAVGDLVSDLEGEDAVDRERMQDISKWPPELEKPPWIQWWLVFHELKAKAKRRAKLLNLDAAFEGEVTEEGVQAVTDMDTEVNENVWEDVVDGTPLYGTFNTVSTSTSTHPHQEMVMEQIGGFGAWVPPLDIHATQDLGAIQRALY